jgi:hypothetical protein
MQQHKKYEHEKVITRLTQNEGHINIRPYKILRQNYWQKIKSKQKEMDRQAQSGLGSQFEMTFPALFGSVQNIPGQGH